MSVEFSNDELKKLYETGKSRKYKLQQHVLRKYITAITILDAAKELRDLWNRPSLNFERLEGNTGGKERYSTRIDRQYRIEMAIDWEGKEKIRIEIIHIEELSNHYGD